MLPFRYLETRGVELRLAPLERIAEAVDERTALVSVSLVQSAEGRVVDLDALRATGAPIFLDATQAVGAYPIDLTGVDYLVAHGYKWLLCPRGLTFFYVSPERRLGARASDGRLEVARSTRTRTTTACPSSRRTRAGWTSRSRGSRRPVGARAWSSSPPWVSSGSPPTTSASPRRSPGSFHLPEPESPIVRFRVDDAEGAAARLHDAGVSCSVRGGSVRLSFHLYNDEADVELAAAALGPLGIGAAA